MFAGYDDGVFMVSAGNLSKTQRRRRRVAVPLLVAGLIIFNTMMGSIAERKREIHVYTSLGLAPAHVGRCFVAEALTYGLIGASFGYVIGQGARHAFLENRLARRRGRHAELLRLQRDGDDALDSRRGAPEQASSPRARLEARLPPASDRQWRIRRRGMA
jgi:hypothetical protein